MYKQYVPTTLPNNLNLCKKRTEGNNEENMGKNEKE